MAEQSVSSIGEGQFWDIIRQSRKGLPRLSLNGDAYDRQSARLVSLLGAMKSEQIVAFDATLREIHRRSDRWDLWGVAFIINGGCSDDGFEYFRRWLLAQGRETFESTMRDPDSLCENIPSGDDFEPDYEDVLHITDEVYETKTGKDLAEVRFGLEDTNDTDRNGSGTKGEEWEEDDLPLRFPKTWAKFAAIGDGE